MHGAGSRREAWSLANYFVPRTGTDHGRGRRRTGTLPAVRCLAQKRFLTSKPADRLLLVSDAIHLAGTDIRSGRLGGVEVEVDGDRCLVAGEDRLAGSLAATAAAVLNGAALIRTHDVRETIDAVRVAERLRGLAP